MAEKQYSADVVVEGLRKILISEEVRLDEEVQGKVEMLIAELQRRIPFRVTDEDAQTLYDGFQSFKTNIFDQHPNLFSELAKAQHPRYLVFACSDSRVSPSTIFNFMPGQAFVSRNIANMVPPFDQLRHTETGAVIEYAIKALKVNNILVIGHSRCGGVERLMNLPDDPHSHTYDFIDDWVKIGLPAKKKVLDENGDLSCLEKESVNNSLGNLMTYPYVRDAMMSGQLALRGGYYDFVNGHFEQWRAFTPPPLPPMPQPF
ncbi:carbonic anhydrase 2-like [Gossypium australe]|uniref:Carbonic anhydrase n=1 Tax=Gossypium australe TaxID=47621 RepID=A0A5B6UNN0_9ROSI|nr:carbonic anhydrase 2-like [Gossypium australe]